MALQFFTKIKKKRSIGAILCVIISLSLSYYIYASEYKYANDKDALSIAITEYAFHGRDKSATYVLETKEIYGNLIVFFKDSSNQDVYGFAKLSKGINQRYRLINAEFTPNRYSAVITIYEFKTNNESYYAVGGHNFDGNINEYGLKSFIGSYFHQDKSYLQKFKVRNPQFLDLHKKSTIMRELGVDGVQVKNFSVDLWTPSLLNSEGTDITENYKKVDSVDRGWGTTVGTAELFMIYFMIAIVMILGLLFAKFFLKD